MTSKLPKYYVYLLLRPDGRVFYVGKGSRKRIHQHESEARSDCRCRKCNTIRKIWREGGKVEKQIVFRTDDEQDAYDYEANLIASYERRTLTNRSDGGKYPRNYSEEGRRRIGEANKRRKDTPETRQKKREASLGRRHTQESIEKIRSAHQGKRRNLSEDIRRRIGNAAKGRITPEIRDKAIESIKGKKHTEERRVKERRAAQKRAKSETWKRNHQQAMAAYREKKNLETAKIIGNLLDQGLPVKEIVKQTGFGERTVYRWKAKLKNEK